MSKRLDALPEIAELVFKDLSLGLKDIKKGRRGLSADTILRAALIKQLRGISYDFLAFELGDSQSYRRFCRISIADTPPSASALQRDIKKIRPETFEEINRLLVGAAAEDGIEKGRKVRVDCTVTETNIHKPSDSALLGDCGRVLIRKLHATNGFVGVKFIDHSRLFRHRKMAILNAKTEELRKQPYMDLLKVTRQTVEAANRAILALQSLVCIALSDQEKAVSLANELLHFVGLADRVIDQTHRRIVLLEKVPAEENVLSIFEPHTDIIIKKKREVEYGHKLCLATGASGLVVDLVVEDGNPADSTLALKMVERQEEIYGCVPRQIAFDGGFASKQNLADIKTAGVTDVAFSKRKGLKVVDMVKSSWVYRKLKNFRAGIEAGISLLKRCFGLRRCTWKGHTSFQAYAWASVVTANLLTLARYDLA